MPSVMQRVGTPNARHNRDKKYREQLENVDSSLIQYNEQLRTKSVEAIYDEYLQPAFEAFNQRQTRKDRRLDVKWGVSTALELQRAMDEKARASKNAIDQKGRPPIREIIWQIGNPQQGYGSAGQTHESRQRIKKMLLECQAEAEKRYPQFAWGNLDFHADEVSHDADNEEHGSLHLHSAFVPLAYQNKQGADVQVAMERCLKEMGFSSFQAWKHDLDNLMEEVLHRHGLERVVMDNHEKHQKSTEYHRQQRLIKETQGMEEQLVVVQAQFVALDAKFDEQKQQYDQNNAVIQAQEEALRLIETVEDYEDEALDLIEEIEAAEVMVTKELPKATRLFKSAEANSFVQTMAKILEGIRKNISSGLARLRIFELTHVVDDPLSEPVQRRANALDNTIASAFAEAQKQPSGGRQKAHERTK